MPQNDDLLSRIARRFGPAQEQPVPIVKPQDNGQTFDDVTDESGQVDVGDAMDQMERDQQAADSIRATQDQLRAKQDFIQKANKFKNEPFGGDYLKSLYPKFGDKIDAARQDGYKDSEIHAYLQQRDAEVLDKFAQEYKNAGVTDDNEAYARAQEDLDAAHGRRQATNLDLLKTAFGREDNVPGGTEGVENVLLNDYDTVTSPVQTALKNAPLPAKVVGGLAGGAALMKAVGGVESIPAFMMPSGRQIKQTADEIGQGVEGGQAITDAYGGPVGLGEDLLPMLGLMGAGEGYDALKNAKPPVSAPSGVAPEAFFRQPLSLDAEGNPVFGNEVRNAFRPSENAGPLSSRWLNAFRDRIRPQAWFGSVHPDEGVIPDEGFSGEEHQAGTRSGATGPMADGPIVRGLPRLAADGGASVDEPTHSPSITPEAKAQDAHDLAENELDNSVRRLRQGQSMLTAQMDKMSGQPVDVETDNPTQAGNEPAEPEGPTADRRFPWQSNKKAPTLPKDFENPPPKLPPEVPVDQPWYRPLPKDAPRGGIFGKAADTLAQAARNNPLIRKVLPNSGATAPFMTFARQSSGAIAGHMMDVAAGKQIVDEIPTEFRHGLGTALDSAKGFDDLPPALKGGTIAAMDKMDPIWQQVKSFSDQMVKMGVITQDQADKMGWQYARRLYLSRMVPGWSPTSQVVSDMRDFLMKNVKGENGLMNEAEANQWMDDHAAGKGKPLQFLGGEPISMDTGNLKARKNIPAPVRAFLGEVKDGGLRGLQTLADSGRVTENAKFFRLVDHYLPQLTAPGDQTTNLSKLGLTDLQKKVLGPLADKEVPAWMADWLKEHFYTQDGALKWFNQSVVGKTFNKGIDWLKYKTIVLSPPSWLHHTAGLVTDASAAGMSPFNPANFKAYMDAIGHVAGNTPEFQAAVKAGAIEPGAFQIGGRNVLREIARQAAMEPSDDPASLMRLASRVLREKGASLGDTRASLDPWFRMAMWLKSTDPAYGNGIQTHDWLGKLLLGGDNSVRLLDPDEAVTHINKFMPAYGEVGPGFKEISRIPGASLTNNPFFRMQVEQFRIMKNALAQSPTKVAATALGLYGASHWGSTAYGWTRADWARAASESERDRADYQGLPGTVSMLIPGMTNSRGQGMFLDLTHYVPIMSLLHGFKPDPRLSGPEQMEQMMEAFTDNAAGGGLLARNENDKVKLGPTFAERVARGAYNTAVPPPLQTFGAIPRALQADIHPRGAFGEPDSPEQEIARGLGFPTFAGNEKRDVVEYQSEKKDIQRQRQSLKMLRKSGGTALPDYLQQGTGYNVPGSFKEQNLNLVQRLRMLNKAEKDKRSDK